MSKALVPDSKREQELVALGRKEGRAEVREAVAKEAGEEKVANLKKDRNELRTDLELAEEDAERGRASHGLVMTLGFGAGTGTGVAAQHYGLDKTTMPNWAKKGIIPVLGTLGGAASLLVGGIGGKALQGFLFGNAIGSGTVSIVKKVAGITT